MRRLASGPARGKPLMGAGIQTPAQDRTVPRGEGCRRVLVTGGSGFIGLAVVAALVKKGHEVLATTTRVSERLPHATNLRWIEWDAHTAALPGMDWTRVDVVLHCALPRNPFAFPEGAVAMFEVTVGATMHLLEIARREGLRILMLSSSEVVGSEVLGSTARPIREDDLLYAPDSFYGAAKSSAELLLRAYASQVSTAILRVFHPYGPGGDRFLVDRLVNVVAEGREVRIEGEDGILLNPVWIDDLSAGLCAAVESDATGVFNFAGPESVTLRRLLEIIGEVVQRPPVIRVVAGGGIQRHCATYDRSVALLNYRPQVGLREGLRRVFALKHDLATAAPA